MPESRDVISSKLHEEVEEPLGKRSPVSEAAGGVGVEAGAGIDEVEANDLEETIRCVDRVLSRERAVRQVQAIFDDLEKSWRERSRMESERERTSFVSAHTNDRMYLYLLVLWALIQYLKSSIERLLSSRSTRLSISRTSVHLSTTSFNFLPSKALSWIPRRHRKGEQEDQRRLRSYWDVGTLIVLVGFFVSQGILLWAFSKALFALYDLVQYSLDSSVTSTVESVSLIKRAPIPIRPPSTSLPPSSQLLIQPLVSRLPLI